MITLSKIGVLALGLTYSLLCNAEVYKCKTAKGVEYQETPCAQGVSSKKLDSAELIGTVATHNYNPSQQQKLDRDAQLNNGQRYKVDGKYVTKAEFDAVEQRNQEIASGGNRAKVAVADAKSSSQGNEADKQYCKSLELRRENIRSQQRVNSTQYLRDEYEKVSKEWQSNCFGKRY